MYKRNGQGGQALVQVALMMVVLLGFVALAVDVGFTYGERRRMQNAADAGALAGARELCFGDPNMAIDTAWAYAVTRNGAQQADVSIENYTVTVTARETVNTFIAGIVGYPTMDVSAIAAAECGEARSAAGLWPVAFYIPVWEDLYSGGEGCNEAEFYVWNDDKEPDCTVYDCDVDDDGRTDFVIGGDRGWLDFSDVVVDPYNDPCVQSGCGASELECYIRWDEAALIELPACIPGDSGVKAGVKDGVESRIDDWVRIPLYEQIGCPPEHPAGSSCPGGNEYFVTSFGCVDVLEWDHSLKLEALDGTGVLVGKAIRVRIHCDGCETYHGGTEPGQPPTGGGLRAVSLVR
jgi:hypothetical protein